MIPSFFAAGALAAVEQLINQALKYDPASQQAIGNLQGKVIAIESTFPPLTFFVQPHSEGLQLLAEFADEPDTRLKGNATALASIAANSQQTSLYGSGVEISGDQTLLQALSSILQNIDIDWEAALAKLIGDVPAHLAGEAIRSSTQWQEQVFARAKVTASEFTVEEAQWLPSHHQVDIAADQISYLRKDVDRLAARVNKLKHQLDEST